MRKNPFSSLVPYHVITRAIDGRKIFARKAEVLRFIFQSYVANIGSPAPNFYRQKIESAAQAILNGEEVPKRLIITPHPPLVYCLSFVLVVNHIHEILVSNTEDGISRYLQCRHNGFAKYYNLKHNRKGNLFERPTKIIPIKKESQFEAVFKYINIINVLDVYQPDWREKGLYNEKEALKFLEKYPFSSFPDFFGERNCKLLAPKEILGQFFGEGLFQHKEEYLKSYKTFLSEHNKLLKGICIE
ncbi:MAG: hypothetical protein LR000_01300 [Candidatus Pacebacteria bacterium]|nr:hypothetical protein [Candidatus Paceibacterota bacterium]